MSVAHEMWRLASLPPAPMIFAAMLGVLAWSLIFRKQDQQAWVMCATLIAAWIIELMLHAVLSQDGFRASLALTDLICAVVALTLGRRNLKEWTVVVYATLVYAILLNVLWLFGLSQAFLSKNDHIALLNVLLGIRLLAVASPGIAYVGKSLGGLLSHHRLAVAVRHKAERH